MLNESKQKITEAHVLSTLRDFIFPAFGKSLIDLDAVRRVHIENGRVTIHLYLAAKVASLHGRLVLMIQNHLEGAGIHGVQVVIDSDASDEDFDFSVADARVRNILIVASGKGGVGKSSTAMNLALALRAEGASVGVLDADIYGPSMRTMLGVPESVKPVLVNEKYVEPIRKYGLATMSVGYLSPDKTPMIWRGPMAVKALQQLLEQTLWGDLDYLIVDMPPGTGDIHISLAQKLQRATALVVTTPQEVALIDARKGLEMFNKVGIPVLGIVENMATHVCSRCGFEEDIFGAHGAAKMAEDYGVAMLGSLPLDKKIREHLDSGIPSVARDPMSDISQCYAILAQRVAVAAWRAKITGMQMPHIEIA